MPLRKITVCYLIFCCVTSVFCQSPPKPYGVLPTKAQLNWHEMEMYCIIHFGMDTYTDKEWGFGDEDPSILNPTKFSAEQIVDAAKAGGFKGVVIVAKHHDGFCLWPTKTTEHNITKSPWKNGKGDMIKAYREACNRLGMQLGLYCSPWDRNNPQYGRAAYVDIYRKQLTELYANYGPLFISWHDGANGGDGYYGGTRELRKIDRTTYYGWDSTWAITKKMQPGAVIFGDVGPSVRWVGNEQGHAGETCWETYTPQAPDEGKKPANGYSKYQEATQGTRNGAYWMPAECDVPLRPGWFYHQQQDGLVKSPYTLLDLYFKSVGRGADLDLGLAPNRQGLMDANDVTSLQQFGSLLKQIFSVNLAKGAVLTASNIRGGNKEKYGPALLLDNDRYSYWATDDNVTEPQLTLNFGKKQTFNIIRLRENIKLGQRVNSIAVDAFGDNNEWKEIATATSIGANRLIRLPENITTGKVRLRITGSAACIALSDFGLFKEPEHFAAPGITRDKNGFVIISTPGATGALHYTLDGSIPNLQSPIYLKPFMLKDGGLVKACGFTGNRQNSETATQQFGLTKSGWKISSPTIPAAASDLAAAIDENTSSFLDLDSDTLPQYLIVDMGKTQSIKAFTYLPRQDKKTAGMVDQYIYSVSDDGIHWQQVSKGEFANIKSNPIEQIVSLDKPINARYFKLSAMHVISGKSISAAELGIMAF